MNGKRRIIVPHIKAPEVSRPVFITYWVSVIAAAIGAGFIWGF